MKEITIITPVYNGVKYIENCLENVIGQNCPVVEHLIMDGGSTDGTVEIVRSYQEQNPHIRLISEKDKGQSDAMNKGITLAEGSLISFLNVDDYYEPNVLNRVSELSKGLPDPSFLCGNLKIWNADGSLKHFNKPAHLSLPELVSDRFEWPYNPTAYFYHKSLHHKVGLYNIENHFCMDYEFILNAARVIELTYIDETWGNFCQVPESKTLNISNNAIDEADRALIDLREKAIAMLSEAQKITLQKILETHHHAPYEVVEPKPEAGWKKIKNTIFSMLGRF